MSDLISRSASVEALCVACNKEYPEEPCEPSECLIRQALEDAPAVDAVEVVHGKPEPYMVQCIGSNGTVVAEYQEGWYCPFCGESGVKNYCPNCGAKMDGERNDDD